MNSTSSSHPKLLAVCESPCSGTNGYGVSLRTFLHEWPRDRLVQFYRSERLRDGSSDGGRMYHAELPGNPLLHAVPFLLGSTPAWMGKYSRRWLETTLGDWQPDVIYSFYYSRSVALYSQWLAGVFNCPYILHVGDDDEFMTAKNLDEIRRAYSEADVRVAISHEMKAEYEKRLDAPFEVLHNGAADEFFEDGDRQRQDGEFIIRYVGSLLRIQHWNAIEDIVEAVQTLAAEGVPVKFEIYCDEWTKKHALALADGKSVLYKGFVGKPELYGTLQSADLLVLPAAFSGTDNYEYQLSMPTKLPEYLASGTPTLIYGPRGMASVELCVRHELGTVIAERSLSTVTASIRDMIDAPEKYRALAARNREFTREKLSAVAARKTFTRIVAAAVAKQESGVAG